MFSQTAFDSAITYIFFCLTPHKMPKLDIVINCNWSCFQVITVICMHFNFTTNELCLTDIEFGAAKYALWWKYAAIYQFEFLSIIIDLYS